MADSDYFTIEQTALTIRRRGAMAIYCGDKPTRHADGSTSYPLRAPLLLMPPDMFDNDDEILAKVCTLLNQHAHLFFDSAKSEDDHG